VENNLKEERFILAHHFRGFSPLLPDCCFRAGEAEHYGRKHVLEESSSPHVQEAEKEKDQD
jgi:hypothetical protein